MQTSAITLTILLIMCAPARAQDSGTLSFVIGTIEQPEGINEGDRLSAGTVIKAGSDALVMVEHRWRSDIPARDCILLAIFGYGQRYTVSADETPGRCDTTVPRDPAGLMSGGPFLLRETRYGDAKFDAPEPAKVSSSVANWVAFDEWIRNAERTFKGVVTSVSIGRISAQGANSTQRWEFSVKPSALESPVPISELKDREVRVYYRKSGFRPEVTRIELVKADSPSSPVSPGDFVLTPDRLTPDRGIPDRPPADLSQRWRCSIDLGVGGVGTLEFTQTDGDIEGVIVASGQKHGVSGSWKGDRIEFWRALSKSSGQPFVGTATTVEDGVVRMGGRFANAYRGVWSADCGVEEETDQTSDASSSGEYEVVLAEVGGQKIQVIKAVRAITGLGLKESKEAVERAPYTVISGVSHEKAREVGAMLRGVGATVELRKTR